MMKNNNGLRAILAAVVSIGILLLMLWLAPMLVSNGEKQTQLQSSKSSQADIQKADILEEETTESAQQTTEAETETETTQNIQANENVNIKMVGDVLLHDPVSASGLMEDGSYNYDHMFVNVKDDIAQADIAIANQEVILGGREIGISGYPAFNGAFEVGDALVNAGFDVVCHGTNHALDRGKTGILNCINYWRNSHPEISVLGIYDSEEMQHQICVKEVKGIRIAILNYTYGTNGIDLPSDMPYAVNLMDRDKIASDLAQAESMADFTVVCPHWGIEYTHQQNSEQESLAKFMAEHGADLILGTHPHVIQPVEWVEADNGNRALVYYSLGNFINYTSDYGAGTAQRALGAMASVNITRDESGVHISDYEAIPLVSHMIDKTTTYKLSDYSDELANENAMKQKDGEFSYEYCVNTSREVLGEAYK